MPNRELPIRVHKGFVIAPRVNLRAPALKRDTGDRGAPYKQ
nr:MAG TPA: hypothetical protein [Caudoviricetes sp.]